jgi:hypothetical protein
MLPEKVAIKGAAASRRGGMTSAPIIAPSVDDRLANMV